MKRFRNFLLTTLLGGAIILLPITIFVLLISIVIGFLGRGIDPLSNFIGVNWEVPDIWVDLISLAVIIIICFLVGLFVRTRLGKGIFVYLENQWLSKLPWYNTIKEIVQAFAGSKKSPFKKVVIVDVFNSGTKMTGFITDESTDGVITVFVPTAPNPTNGFIFHMTEDNIEYLDVKTEDAMRTIVGMGVGTSGLKK